ncbi:MAG TPA: hypothetical protein VH085_12980, partial [Nocardioides sp.]|nr:hypothetical protein [Nocardioides sp.]
PRTVEAMATKADGFWVVDVVVGGDLLAVRVESLVEVDAAVSTALTRKWPNTPLQVHIDGYLSAAGRVNGTGAKAQQRRLLTPPG